MQAHGFRFSFTPLSGVLFTFPSRYSSTIGLPGVLSLGGWCRRIRTGLLRPRPTQGTAWVQACFGYGAVTRCGPPFQARSPTCSSSLTAALQPRARLDARGLGWPPFARRYSGGHSCFPFLRLLRCFSSAGSPRPKAGAAPSRGGLPHSETRGSKAARASPRNIVACHVLHRLREPQASPVRPLSLAAASGIRANGPITEPPTLARRVSSRYSITLFVVCRRDPRTTGRSPNPAQRAATPLPSILSMNPHRVHGGKSGE